MYVYIHVLKKRAGASKHAASMHDSKRAALASMQASKRAGAGKNALLELACKLASRQH
jgi:hypothetical protein